MTINYELQIVNYDEKRQKAGDFVRTINWPRADFMTRLKEAQDNREISSNYTYCIYAIDENKKYTLIGQGDYDENDGGGFYFIDNN